MSLVRTLRLATGPGRRRADAWAARLGRWSIGLSPGALSLGEGLRAAVAVALVVALMNALHWPELAWAAIASLWTCLADPGGPGGWRLRVLGLYALASTLFAVVGAVAAGFGWQYAALAAFCCAILGSMGRLYGAAATQAGLLAIVACVVALDRPSSGLADMTRFALVFLGGCGWAMLLSLTLWRIHPFRPARQSLAAVFTALAGLTSELATPSALPGDAGSIRGAGAHRHAVRVSIEGARAATDQLLRSRGLDRTGASLLLGLEVAERIFVQLIAFDDLLDAAPPDTDVAARAQARVLRRLALLLQRLAKWLSAGGDAPDSLRGAAERMLLAARRPNVAGQSVLLAITDEVRALCHPALPPAAGYSPARGAADWLAPIRANLRWDSLVLRNALRCGVLVTAAVMATHALRLPEGYWATMAVVLVQQPQLAATWPRALERTVGSVLGGLIAALLAWALPSSTALTLVVFPLAMATMAVRTVSYGLFVLFLTPLFVLVVGLTLPGTDELALAGLRAANNVLGSVLALGGSLLLWPSRETQRLRFALAEAVAENGRYAALAFRRAPPWQATDTARRAAGLASVNAEVSRDHAALESRRHRARLETAASILVLVRRLTGTATTTWVYPDSAARDDRFAAWVGETAHALADALRDARAPDALTPAPSTPDPSNRDPPDVASRERAVQQVTLLHQAIARLATTT